MIDKEGKEEEEEIPQHHRRAAKKQHHYTTRNRTNTRPFRNTVPAAPKGPAFCFLNYLNHPPCQPAVLATSKFHGAVSHATSRTKQETDLSSLAGAPSDRVFATRGLRDRKTPEVAVGVKKVLAKSKRRKKSYGRFKTGTKNHQWGKRGHGPDRSQNHVILVHLPVVDQKESPTSEFLSLTVRADFDADWRM